MVMMMTIEQRIRDLKTEKEYRNSIVGENWRIFSLSGEAKVSKQHKHNNS